MAYEILITPAAKRDLEEYAERIAEDSEDLSTKWLREAWEKIFSLGEMPRRFAKVPESPNLAGDIRDMRHYSHRIVFRVNDTLNSIEILRVWHGARRTICEADVR